MSENMIEKKMRLGDLFDFYGELLTEKQKNILFLYCMQDLSFGEISEELGISRQAVFDTIRRVDDILNNFETKLSLLEKFRYTQKVIKEINSEIMDIKEAEEIEKNVNLKNRLSKLAELSSSILD